MRRGPDDFPVSPKGDAVHGVQRFVLHDGIDQGSENLLPFAEDDAVKARARAVRVFRFGGKVLSAADDRRGGKGFDDPADHTLGIDPFVGVHARNGDDVRARGNPIDDLIGRQPVDQQVRISNRAELVDGLSECIDHRGLVPVLLQGRNQVGNSDRRNALLCRYRTPRHDRRRTDEANIGQWNAPAAWGGLCQAT